MILLTSNGLTSQELLLETSRRMKKGAARAAIVTTASVGYKALDWNLPRLRGELASLGFQSVCFDLDEEPANRLLEFDAVEFIGGNPLYLLDRMRKSGCKPVLEAFLLDRLVIGVSAGSLVLQKSVELIHRFSPEMNADVGLADFTAMGLTDLEILPHYSRSQWRFDRFEARAREYEAETGQTVIRLDDGQGVFVDGPEVYPILNRDAQNTPRR